MDSNQQQSVHLIYQLNEYPDLAQIPRWHSAKNNSVGAETGKEEFPKPALAVAGKPASNLNTPL